MINISTNHKNNNYSTNNQNVNPIHKPKKNNVDPDYSFKFYKNPEDFLDGNIQDYISDMVDKYYGDKAKEAAYNAAMKRINSHKKTDPKTGIQYIEFYRGKDSDLKQTQLELFDEKSEKLARYYNGEVDLYKDAAEVKNDELYVKSNNSAYNHKQATKNSLATLGKYGDRVNYLPVKNSGNTLKGIGHALLNVPIAIRNAVSTVYRLVGRPISAIYGAVAKNKSGIYANKPMHRFEARKDYFIRAENERLAAEGKKPRPIRTMMKARLKALFKSKEGNAAVLEAGYQDIKTSYVEKAKFDYYKSKYEKLNSHITWLEDEKIKIFSHNMDPETQEKFNRIERAEQDAINQRNKILNDPEYGHKIANDENVAVLQTDAVSLNQHDRANKASVTRVVTGAKILTLSGARLLGPRMKDWLLNHSKVMRAQTEKVARTTITPNEIKRTWVDEAVETKEVPDYTTVTKVTSEQDLVEQFNIKHLMDLDNSEKVSYAYDNWGNKAYNNNLEYFRGAAQRINGQVVSISDGKGYDITKITRDYIPSELLTNGSISDNANLFDILAALRRQAGENVTSKDLIDQVLSCGSKSEQEAMIKSMTEGLDFWRSCLDSGIATGWSSGNVGISKALESLKTTTEQIVTGSHLETEVIPGHFVETVVKGTPKIVTEDVVKNVLVNNPRIVKALGIGDMINNGVTIMDAIQMAYENARNTESKIITNKPQKRQYNPKQKVGFTGNDKNKDKALNTVALNNEIQAEINSIDR